MDYTTIPATVTIKNLNKEEKEVVQLYRVNTFVELNAEEEIKLTVNDSKEVAYYAQLATENIEVTVA